MTLTVQATNTKQKFLSFPWPGEYDGIIFVDLKLPSLIASLINPCKYSPVACMISQIILNFIFFSTCMLVRTMQVFAETVTL